jgi:hypothetical protein
VADLFIAYDPTADAGERLAPEVRAEIAEVAPSTVLNGSITAAKLADDAVTQAKIYPGAVGPTEIAVAGVETTNLDDGAVTTSKLDNDAVTPAKCGTGVVTGVDSSDNATETVLKFVSAAQYAAIGSPSPNTVYFIS